MSVDATTTEQIGSPTPTILTGGIALAVLIWSFVCFDVWLLWHVCNMLRSLWSSEQGGSATRTRSLHDTAVVEEVGAASSKRGGASAEDAPAPKGSLEEADEVVSDAATANESPAARAEIVVSIAALRQRAQEIDVRGLVAGEADFSPQTVSCSSQ